MPNYAFIDESTNLEEEVFFKFADAPKIGSYIDYDGRKLRRLPTVVCASSNSIARDPYSAKDFNRLTEKGGTFGAMYDLSKELSEKRAEKDGIDPISEARDKKTAAEGMPVFTDPKVKLKKANEKLKKWGVTLTEKKPATRNKK